jgi:hypothetical protein
MLAAGHGDQRTRARHAKSGDLTRRVDTVERLSRAGQKPHRLAKPYLAST